MNKQKKKESLALFFSLYKFLIIFRYIYNMSSLLDDEDILIEEIKNTLRVDNIKNLWKDGDLKDVEDVLNEKYIHKEGFNWKRLLRSRGIVYQVEWDYTAGHLFLCELEIDREGRLVLKFDLINLHIYFKDKEKEEKFIQDILDLFGNCMKEIFFKPQIEICYGY